AQERRDREDLVADELEEPPDLPLRHRAEAQPGHVDEGPQIRGHDEVRARRIREDEARILAGDARLDELTVERHRALDLLLEASPDVLVRLGDRVRLHRRRGLELHVALALLVERHAGAVANELVRQRPAHAADAEREDDMLDRAAMTGFDDA